MMMNSHHAMLKIFAVVLTLLMDLQLRNIAEMDKVKMLKKHLPCTQVVITHMSVLQPTYLPVLEQSCLHLISSTERTC